jgi:hypothetical protein
MSVHFLPIQRGVQDFKTNEARPAALRAPSQPPKDTVAPATKQVHFLEKPKTSDSVQKRQLPDVPTKPVEVPKPQIKFPDVPTKPVEVPKPQIKFPDAPKTPPIIPQPQERRVDYFYPVMMPVYPAPVMVNRPPHGLECRAAQPTALCHRRCLLRHSWSPVVAFAIITSLFTGFMISMALPPVAPIVFPSAVMIAAGSLFLKAAWCH